MPLAATQQPRTPGGWEGQVWVAEDFNAELSADELSTWYGEDGAPPEP